MFLTVLSRSLCAFKRGILPSEVYLRIGPSSLDIWASLEGHHTTNPMTFLFGSVKESHTTWACVLYTGGGPDGGFRLLRGGGFLVVFLA